MKTTGSVRAWKSAVAVLSVACFLSFSITAASPVLAAEEWETWPNKPVEPGVEVPEPSGPATAGAAAGQGTWAGLSAGTIGWIAVGTAALIGIAIAAGGGGGGGGSTAPAHPAP